MVASGTAMMLGMHMFVKNKSLLGALIFGINLACLLYWMSRTDIK